MKTFKLLVFAFLMVSPIVAAAQSVGRMPDNNWWTMSNLNLDVPDSYCYNDSIAYCEKYGRLYTWDAAQKVCASLGEGWRLPSTAEWKKLLAHFGGVYEENVNDGKTSFETLLRTDKPTFAATLGGNRNVDGTYDRIERHGF